MIRANRDQNVPQPTKPYSSASASGVRGILRPSVLAVLALKMSLVLAPRKGRRKGSLTPALLSKKYNEPGFADERCIAGTNYERRMVMPFLIPVLVGVPLLFGGGYVIYQLVH